MILIKIRRRAVLIAAKNMKIFPWIMVDWTANLLFYPLILGPFLVLRIMLFSKCLWILRMIKVFKVKCQLKLACIPRITKSTAQNVKNSLKIKVLMERLLNILVSMSPCHQVMKTNQLRWIAIVRMSGYQYWMGLKLSIIQGNLILVLIKDNLNHLWNF